MSKVKEFGEAKGFDKLTTGFLEADEYTGWEMTSVAVHLLNAPGSYRFPAENGFCYLVFREIELVIKDNPTDLFGAMKGTIMVAPGVDLMEPMDVEWEASS
jgi:hypothetical protein